MEYVMSMRVMRVVQHDDKQGDGDNEKAGSCGRRTGEQMGSERHEFIRTHNEEQRRTGSAMSNLGNDSKTLRV